MTAGIFISLTWKITNMTTAQTLFEFMVTDKSL